MQHSSIVGGSTAKRVINCPGSVALVNKMPPKPSSKYADEGTLLHNVIAMVMESNREPEDFIGHKYNDLELTSALVEEKLRPALDLFNQIDEGYTMEYMVETEVSFGPVLPGVFGSTDLMGRVGDVAYVIDWKFGDGVVVEAEENPQLMFYAAAAMRTAKSKWVFDGAKEVECVIIQPPFVKRWRTSFDRIRQFERELFHAVKIAQTETAPLSAGEHCRWCAAKPVCPQQTGAAERALKQQIADLPMEQIAAYLSKADAIEQWLTDVRALALQVLESGGSVPGYKLVAKRATRQWTDEAAAKAALLADLPESEVVETSLVSPAQAEKKLKKLKKALPEGVVVSISSGNTLASEDDPRPAIVLIGKQLTAALNKLL